MRKKYRKIVILFFAVALVLGTFNTLGMSSSLAESETDNSSLTPESSESATDFAEPPTSGQELEDVSQAEEKVTTPTTIDDWWKLSTLNGHMAMMWVGDPDDPANMTGLNQMGSNSDWMIEVSDAPGAGVEYGQQFSPLKDHIDSVQWETRPHTTFTYDGIEYTLSLVPVSETKVRVTMEVTNNTTSTKYINLKVALNTRFARDGGYFSYGVPAYQLPYNSGLRIDGITGGPSYVHFGSMVIITDPKVPGNTPVVAMQGDGGPGQVYDNPSALDTSPSGSATHPFTYDDNPAEGTTNLVNYGGLSGVQIWYPEHKVEPGESFHESFLFGMELPGGTPPEIESITPDSTGVPATPGQVFDISSNVATGTPFAFSGIFRDLDSAQIRPTYSFNGETIKGDFVNNSSPKGNDVEFEGELPIPTTLPGGIYDFTVNAQDDSSREGLFPVSIKLMNITAPVITADNVTIQQNITPDYVYDPMANSDVHLSATDDIDGAIPNSSITYTSNVNPAVPGDYKVTYSVTNSNNKTTTKETTVTVAAVNFTVTEHFVPEGEVETTNPVTINIGKDYTQTKANLEATKFPVTGYENIEYSFTGLDGSWVSMPATLELSDITANKDIYYRADKIKAVAKIGTTGYATLEEAIVAANAATGPSKIEMLIDQYELKSPQPINKEVTITTASKTDLTLPYRGSNTQAEITLGTQLTTAPLFNVVAGAEFTLGNIKIDGNGTTEVVAPPRIFETSGNALITNAGTVNVGGDIATSTEVDESAIIEDYKGTSSPIVNESGGILNIEGKIQDNTGQDGGAVNAKAGSTVNIKGGNITGNTATGNGGGVYVAATAALNIDSGIINNNHASTKGGGIYQQGDMSVKGKVEVKGNTSGTTNVVENVYLVKTTADQSQLESANYIQVNGNVTAGSEIGVTTETTPLVGDLGKQYTIIAAPASDEVLTTMSAYFKHDQQVRNVNALSVLIDRRHAGKNLILDSTSLVPFHFTKVDAADQTKPLAGATFKLYVCEEDHPEHAGEVVTDEIVTAGSCWVPYKDENGTEVEVTSNKDGIVEFGSLPDNDYMLVETKSPSGYEKPTGQWLITTNSAELTPDADTDYPVTVEAKGDRPPLAYIDGDANHETLDDFKFQNMKQQSLPFNGGKGIYLFIIAGLVLMSSSGLLFYKSRQKQKV